MECVLYVWIVGNRTSSVGVVVSLGANRGRWNAQVWDGAQTVGVGIRRKSESGDSILPITTCDYV